jgi:hypothetical protein
MVLPWVKSVRDSQQLSVYNDLATGRWPRLYHDALAGFNKLSDDHKLGVKFTEAKDEKSANVVMRFGKGPVSYEFDGRKQSDPTFKGDTAHGKTFLFSWWRSGSVHMEVDGILDKRSGIEKAAIFLPSNPQGSPGAEVTLDVMKVIAVHELVHACGLDNDDHARDGLFYSPLYLYNGKLKVPETGKDQKLMPPLWIDRDTIQKIMKFWIGLIDL